MAAYKKNGELRMNQATLSFDYTGLAIKNIRKAKHVEELAPFRVRLLRAMIKIGLWVAPSLSARLFTRLVCWGIDRKTKQVIRDIGFFEDAAWRLEREIAETGVLPSAVLASNLEEFNLTHIANRQKRQSVVDLLRQRNPDSRVAVSLERLFANEEKMAAATEGLRFVASGQSLEVMQQRNAFGALRAKIRKNENEEFDDELLLLAERAIEASDARDLSTDATWTHRMTSGPVH